MGCGVGSLTFWNDLVFFTTVFYQFIANFCFVHPIFRFWILVTFGDGVTKILRNLCLHLARQDGQDGKKRNENHATKVTKIPKYWMCFCVFLNFNSSEIQMEH